MSDSKNVEVRRWELDHISTNLMEYWRMYLSWHNFFFTAMLVAVGWFFVNNDLKMHAYYVEFCIMMLAITLTGFLGPIFLFLFVNRSRSRYMELRRQFHDEVGYQLYTPIFFQFAPTIAFFFIVPYLALSIFWLMFAFFQ